MDPDRAGVVRGKIISLREEDFVAAARIGGAPTSAILLRHPLRGFLSYLIVSPPWRCRR